MALYGVTIENTYGLVDRHGRVWNYNTSTPAFYVQASSESEAETRVRHIVDSLSITQGSWLVERTVTAVHLLDGDEF